MHKQDDPEYNEGVKAWRNEQARLTEGLRVALERYAKFHADGFEAWFKKWKKHRRVK